MSDDLKIAKMISTDKFYKDVDTLVKNHKLTYIDAVVHYCTKNDIELEVAASMIKSNYRIKSQVQYEGEELNFLPKSARLPI
jgi:hypothetical protein